MKGFQRAPCRRSGSYGRFYLGTVDFVSVHQSLRTVESDRNPESGKISEAKTLDTAVRSGEKGRTRKEDEEEKEEKKCRNREERKEEK